ncbi:MAG: cobyric acid synthase CobQ, partial [Pseudomonadota bacterium]
LGLLEVETELVPAKTVVNRIAADVETGLPLDGYEIHMGRTVGSDTGRPMVTFDGEPDGAVRADGRVRGSYLHGLFAGDMWRRAYLESLGVTPGSVDYRASVETALDNVADVLEHVVDPAIFRLSVS